MTLSSQPIVLVCIFPVYANKSGTNGIFVMLWFCCRDGGGGPARIEVKRQLLQKLKESVLNPGVKYLG